MPTSRFSGSTLGARWPLALLVISVGLTAVAVYESIRVGMSNQVVAEGVVHDYAEFAAWSYARHLDQSLRDMAREVLGPINHEGLHADPRIPVPNDLAHFLRFDSTCFCHGARFGPNAETFIAFSIRADTLAFARNTHPKPLEGWEIDRPLAIPVPMGAFTNYSPGDRALIVETIRRQIRETPDPEHGYTYRTFRLGIGPRMIAYATMATTWGDTIVYGAQYTMGAVRQVFDEIMSDNDLLPPSFQAGKRNRDFIDVVVMGANGQTIFASNGEPRVELMARSQMAPRFAGLSVQASIAPDQAGALVVGGLPKSRLPFLLGVLVLAAALMVAAVTLLRREAELNRVRADWIASVSHELRTPLAQIRLFLDTVRLGRAPPGERQDWALTQVDRETTRLSHLIEKVLSFSRVGRGSQPSAQPTDLAAEAQKLVAEFRPLAETRGVTVETAITSVPELRLRRDTVRHILLNLLDNAVKYGPSGQTITVRVDRAGETVTLSVADQGPGVPLTERDTIWRPFARGKSSAEQGGSGIGLSIVRDLATQHGGHASVGASPSGGALFSVVLPLHTVVA